MIKSGCSDSNRMCTYIGKDVQISDDGRRKISGENKMYQSVVIRDLMMTKHLLKEIEWVVDSF